MTAYQPVCVHCRTSAPTYFKSCDGCQERRRQAWEKAVAKDQPGPVPSVNKPKEENHENQDHPEQPR